MMMVAPAACMNSIMLKDAIHDMRRKTERRLVEHDELWARHERPHNRQHLLLAPRRAFQPFACGVHKGLRSARRTCPCLPRSHPRRGASGSPSAGLNNRHIGKDAPSFRTMGDAEPENALRRGAGDVFALEGEPAAGSGDEAGDRLGAVVLPAPLAPISDTGSPRRTSSESSLTAVTLP